MQTHGRKTTPKRTHETHETTPPQTGRSTSKHTKRAQRHYRTRSHTSARSPITVELKIQTTTNTNTANTTTGCPTTCVRVGERVSVPYHPGVRAPGVAVPWKRVLRCRLQPARSQESPQVSPPTPLITCVHGFTPLPHHTDRTYVCKPESTRTCRRHVCVPSVNLRSMRAHVLLSLRMPRKTWPHCAISAPSPANEQTAL